MGVPLIYINDREAYMILNIRLHTLRATLFSMTLRDLNLVLLMNWRLLGISLRKSLQKLSWKINCMQFGTLIYSFKWLVDSQAPCRYCIPMDSPRPILSAELEFFNQGTGRGRLRCHFVGEVGEIVYLWLLLPSFHFHWLDCHKIY